MTLAGSPPSTPVFPSVPMHPERIAIHTPLQYLLIILVISTKYRQARVMAEPLEITLCFLPHRLDESIVGWIYAT